MNTEHTALLLMFQFQIKFSGYFYWIHFLSYYDLFCIFSLPAALDAAIPLSQEFFLTVKDILRRSPTSGPESFAKWTEVEKQLNKE